MSQIHWAHQVNGNFGTAADWTGGVVPGAADAAILDAAGTANYFVAATTKETVASIQTAATAQLSVRVGAAAGGFSATGGSGAGANAGTIAIFDGGDFIFGGTITNTGTITLGSTGDATLLSLSAAGTLSGAGKVTLSNNASNQITAASAATLTNVNNTISGAGTIGGGGLTLDNEAAGVIDASGATNALILNTGASAIANAGIIEATGAGGLVIDSTIHNTATGSIEVLDGSSLTLNGAAITGGTLLVGDATNLDLTGFNLSNVTLKTQGTGTIQVNGATLRGVINQADIAVAAGTDLFVSGGLNNAGVISLITNNNGGENGTQIQLTGSTVLGGGGSIVMGGTTPWDNYIDGQPTGLTLTNVNETIEGAGHIGDDSLNTGWLTLVNDTMGVIDATDSTTQLVISTGGNSTMTNDGVLEGTGAAGLEINVAVNNAGGGRIFALNGSQVDLADISVTGGVLNTVGTGVIKASGYASLVNVDSKGALVAQDGDLFYLSGTLTNSGTITLAAGAHGASLQMAGAVTLTGGGHVRMVDTGGAPNANAIGGDFYAPGGSLINVNNTISGAGTIGNEGVGGAPLVAITNEAAGVIDATDASTALVIAGVSGTITNAGLIEGTGKAGLVVSGGAIANAGGTILAANGSQVVLNNNAGVTGGTLNSAGSGAIYANGAYFTNVTNKATVDLGDGGALTVSKALVNSGVISLEGDSHGANLFISGAFTLSGGGSVLMGGPTPWNNAIGGTAAGQTLINVDNTISGAGTIGGNNLNLVNDAAGVIDATDAATALTINNGGAPAATFTNYGLIEATGAAGLAITSTSIHQISGGAILAANGSQVVLNAATVTGGTVTSAGSGVVNADSASFINVTNKANVDIGDGGSLTLSGTLTNSGVISLAGGGHGANLFVSGKFNLSGGGAVVMGGASPWDNDIAGSASGQTLANVNNTISGAGNIGGNNLIIINGVSGVIDANTSNTLTLNNGGAAVTNKGLMEATVGGNFTISGDSIQNAGGTILAAAGSQVALNNNANITGGTVRTSGTGVINIQGGNSFSGLTIAGNVEALDGDVLHLGGAVKNNGVISLQGGGHGGGMGISGAVTLSGTGSVNIGGPNPWDTSIGGDGSGSVLTNDSTIQGEGHVSVVLVNGATGIIDGKGPGVGYGLYLDGNSTAIANSGLIEASSSGLLTINDAVTNGSTGRIVANGGTVVVQASIANQGLMELLGGGTLNIDAGVNSTGAGVIESHGGTVNVNTGVSGGLAVDGGVLDLTQSGVSNDVSFLGGGKLELNQSQSYTGSIRGFSKTGANSLDLTDIGFANASEASFVENAGGTSGVLTVTNGSATAHITLIGNYSTSKFVTSNDGHGGTKVVDPTAPMSANVVAPVHAFIGAMAAFGADAGAVVRAPGHGLRSDEPLLAASAHGRGAIA